MSGSLIIPIILAVSLGVLYFIIDFYKEHIRIHISIISGISISFFFLVLMPEILTKLPEFPLGLDTFDFLFILIGFSFIHLSDKFILQKVESKSQKRIRELKKMEENLDLVQKNFSDAIVQELDHEELDIDALKQLTEVIKGLRSQEKIIHSEIITVKKKISAHVLKDLDKLDGFFQIIYHLIKGIILINLLVEHLLSGILFYVLISTMALVSAKISPQALFSDLDIKLKHIESKKRNFVVGISLLIGVFIGAIFEVINPINLEVVFILFSFISGVILYNIIKNVIPEKEKGKPVYFIIGLIGFSLLIFMIKIIESNI